MKHLLPFLLVVSLCGCSKHANEIRHYKEVDIDAPEKQPQMAEQAETETTETAAPAGKLTWTCPAGWVEQPGSNMRLVTFLVGPAKTECTIVSFPGNAGGLKPNVIRWLGQLNVEVNEETLDPFLQKQPALTTKGGLACTVFDFSEMVAGDDATAMLAGMAAFGEQTVFVKLMGPKPLLAQEKENFTALCQSLDVSHD